MNLIEQIRVNDVSIDGYQGTYQTESPEWIRVIVDADDKVLAGIKSDGTVEWSVGVPAPVRDYVEQQVLPSIEEQLDLKVDKEEGMSLIDASIANSMSLIESPEYIQVTTDEEDKIIIGIKENGAVYIPILENDSIDLKVDDAIERIDASVNEALSDISEKVGPVADYFSEIDDPEGRLEIKTDSEQKIISYRDEEGILHENVGIESSIIKTNSLNLTDSGMSEFQLALMNAGFNPKSPIDFSDKTFIHIPYQPRCALINISGVDSMPKQKNVNWHAYAEVWANGIYFKKKVLLNDQGNSSRAQEKHNFAVDFCEDDWIGDETTTIKIGNWVSQDSYHFKAYYTSGTKAECPISYKVYEKMLSIYSLEDKAPYMEYYSSDYNTNNYPSDNIELNFEIAARCFPDGFPVIAYLNGEFYGIFSWQLKKHRDNFHMNSKSVDNIHLDGSLGASEFWNGIIKWSLFEVRNPKKLVYATAHAGSYKYDADVALDNIAGNDDGSTEYDIWEAGSYAVNKIVIHNGHYYINTVADNNSEPIYDKKNNGDDAPDFKNKTGCGWINCTNTIKVKEKIIEVSKYQSEIAAFENQYINNEITLSELKTEIEKRFSMKWMIRYAILITIVQDGDSVRKNWQWTTWGDINGKIKWFANPYDMDGAFGVDSTHSFGFGTPQNYTFGSTENVPIYWAWKYYIDDIKSEYAKYRNADVISYKSIFRLFEDWILSIGIDNYKNELKRWPDTPSQRDNYMSTKWQYIGGNVLYYGDDRNSDWNSTASYGLNIYVRYNFRLYKSLQENNRSNTPVPFETTEYWEDVTIKPEIYNVNDIVFDGYSSFRRFKALESITVTEDVAYEDRTDHLVNAPFGKIYTTYPHEGGVFESIYRISNWIKEKIRLMDIQMDYNN